MPLTHMSVLKEYVSPRILSGLMYVTVPTQDAHFETLELSCPLTPKSLIFKAALLLPLRPSPLPQPPQPAALPPLLSPPLTAQPLRPAVLVFELLPALPLLLPRPLVLALVPRCPVLLLLSLRWLVAAAVPLVLLPLLLRVP